MDSSTDKKHEQDPPPTTAEGVNAGNQPPLPPENTQHAPVPAKRKRRIVRTAVESSTTTTSSTLSGQPHVSSQGQRDVEDTTTVGGPNIATVSDQVFGSELHESSTITRTFKKTIKQSQEFMHSSSSSREYLVEEASERLTTPPQTPQRLKKKVALYEKVWSSGSGSGTELNLPMDTSVPSGQEMPTSDDNPFDIDVFEIEKRLREERKRGLAEAEAAKQAFQQIQLRSTPQPKPRKVEVQEDQLASPFNVTLKTTSKITPGAVTGRIELEEHSSSSSPFNVTLRTTQRYRRHPPPPMEPFESPFNVTLRTTTRHHSSITPPSSASSCSLSPLSPDGKLASARFLEGERTVREVKSADGVTTIVTSSMTSDGSKHEEKIFRHGEGYLSPRNSPHREMRASTPSRSVDMMAGGRRICIKLEQEEQQMEMTSSYSESFDQTDSLSAKRRLFEPSVSSGTVSLETPANIDIIVGKGTLSHPQQLQQQFHVETTKQTEQMPWQTQQQQHHHYHPSSPSTLTAKTTTKITTTSHQHQTSSSRSSSSRRSESQYESFETVPGRKTTSLTKTIQSQGSSPSEESQRGFVKREVSTQATTPPAPASDPSRIGYSPTSPRQQKPHKYFFGETLDVERQSAHTTSSTAAGGDLVKKRLELLNYGRDGLGHGSGEFAHKASYQHQSAEISDDSDTEGAAASSIVIVPARSAATSDLESSAITTTVHSQQTHSTTASVPSQGTLSKSLPLPQTQHPQSTVHNTSATAAATTTAHSTNEYQEFQSTMAAINFARSNSQYDSHIKEKR
uniref:Uncharacterized protein n=1 Tax=Musca domestica TaxID=7370 RepID=A0A1I8MKU1_MUSDO